MFSKISEYSRFVATLFKDNNGMCRRQILCTLLMPWHSWFGKGKGFPPIKIPAPIIPESTLLENLAQPGKESQLNKKVRM